MPNIQRLFKQALPGTSKEERHNKPLDSFLHERIIVVLGAPGLGKTTIFEEFSNIESDAMFVRIGELLVATDVEAYKNKVLYLDGLDEQRSKFHGQGVMDALVSKLRLINPLKVRISCRTAEWHGTQDISAISDLFPSDILHQLILQPIPTEQLTNLLTDDFDSNFIKGAQERNLDDFLNNPGDFFLLREFYKEEMDWPETRTALMEGACHALLKEVNPEHSEEDDLVNNTSLFRASEYLFAIMMLSGVEGIATKRLNADKVFPAIHELDENLTCMRIASKHRLFKPIESSRVESRHRKISEYMAARYLTRRVKDGLSLRRLMTLLTGFDGKTAPDLRGVYAWLVTLLAGSSEKILHHDPYGAIIYGDTYSWTPYTKLTALKLLKELSHKDPWFRQQDRSTNELGGLVDRATIKYIIKLIQEDSGGSHLLSVIFNAISYSKNSQMPELEECLINYIENKNNPDHLRSDAIQALNAIVDKSQRILVNILEGINSEEFQDKRQELRGTLIKYLYPNIIEPCQIIDFLVKPDSGYIGSYYMFLVHDIFTLTSREDLRKLAIHANKLQKVEVINSSYSQFLNQLSLNLIKEFYSEASLKDIYSWLKLSINQYDSNTHDTSQRIELTSILERDQEKLFKLFLFHLEILADEEKESHQFWWRYNEVAIHALKPKSFVSASFELLTSNPSHDNEIIIFELLCQIYMNLDLSEQVISLDDLENLATKINASPDILGDASFCSLETHEWRIKNSKRKEEQLDKKKKQLAENLKEISTHRIDIKSGDAVGILLHYAKIWLCRFSDVDRNSSPAERLENEIGKDNIPDLYEGFSNVIYKDIFFSIKEIADTDLERKSYHIESLMIATLDIISDVQGKDKVLSLPDDKLSLAIAYNFTNRSNNERPWVTWIRESKPKLYSKAIETFWRYQLNATPSSLNSIYEFRETETDFDIKIIILAKLLNDYPKLKPELLNSMLKVCIGNIERLQMEVLIDKLLSARRHFKKEGTKAMLLSTGYMQSSTIYNTKLHEELKNNNNAHWIFYEYVFLDIFNKNAQGKYIRSIKYRKNVLELLAPYFKNVWEESTGSARMLGDRDEETIARDIRSLIQTFINDKSSEATECLEALKCNTKMSAWHFDIHYAIADHIRFVREARFTYPSTSKVVKTLSNTEPANVSDLKALIIDTLLEIAAELRNGNTDPYKQFWNVGRHSKATGEHIDENTSRDRLLDLLRLKLKHLDIVAEPESMYADDKRADIAIYYKNMKLPIEIKRDDHSEIWVAAEKQLNRQYARDPASEGNGIYLLFWFDGKGMKRPPSDVEKPTCAQTFKTAIDYVIPESSLGLIESIVIDVSIPEGK